MQTSGQECVRFVQLVLKWGFPDTAPPYEQNALANIAVVTSGDDVVRILPKSHDAAMVLQAEGIQEALRSNDFFEFDPANIVVLPFANEQPPQGKVPLLTQDIAKYVCYAYHNIGETAFEGLEFRFSED